MPLNIAVQVAEIITVDILSCGACDPEILVSLLLLHAGESGDNIVPGSDLIAVGRAVRRIQVAAERRRRGVCDLLDIGPDRDARVLFIVVCFWCFSFSRSLTFSIMGLIFS